MNRIASMVCAVGLVCVLAGASLADWADSFYGGEFDLTTWTFLSYPLADTFTQTIKPGADGNADRGQRSRPGIPSGIEGGDSLLHRLAL